MAQWKYAHLSTVNFGFRRVLIPQRFGRHESRRAGRVGEQGIQTRKLVAHPEISNLKICIIEFFFKKMFFFLKKIFFTVYIDLKFSF